MLVAMVVRGKDLIPDRVFYEQHCLYNLAHNDPRGLTTHVLPISFTDLRFMSPLRPPLSLSLESWLFLFLLLHRLDPP